MYCICMHYRNACTHTYILYTYVYFSVSIRNYFWIRLTRYYVYVKSMLVIDNQFELLQKRLFKKDIIIQDFCNRSVYFDIFKLSIYRNIGYIYVCMCICESLHLKICRKLHIYFFVSRVFEMCLIVTTTQLYFTKLLY